MKLPRRKFLHLTAAAAALPAAARLARAQAYPTRPVRIVVGFAAGGSTDIGARVIGQWLHERLGQPFVIENRPGAGTNVATESVVRAPPDGYTLLMVGPSSAVNATLYDKLNFVFLRDIAPVASLIRQPQIMLANPSVTAQTVPELIAYAKANPGKVTMASAGVGSAGHLVGELFKLMAGVDFVHVPYRGAGPALADLLGGQVVISFAGIAGSIEHVRSGKLRALAVTTAAPSPALPDVPTVSEFVPGFEAGDWLGVGAPKNTPPAIVDKLNSEIAAALADPKIEARFADLGGTPLALTPAEFGKLLADETEIMGQGDPRRPYQAGMTSAGSADTAYAFRAGKFTNCSVSRCAVMHLHQTYSLTRREGSRRVSGGWALRLTRRRPNPRTAPSACRRTASAATAGPPNSRSGWC
jgi:tripartite-type tricarboxylate transporter receptor subunit TctC